MITKDSIFWFGKYKDIPVIDIIQANPDYIEWCIINVKGFELDEEMDHLLSWRIGFGEDLEEDYYGLTMNDTY